jgi:hypothetical protein
MAAPTVAPPDPKDYENPEIETLTREIDTLQNEKDLEYDTTAFDKIYTQQENFLNLLLDVANGRQQTQAEVQGKNVTDLSNAAIRGSAKSIQGTQAVGAARQANQVAARQELAIASVTQQAAATERQQKFNQAQNQMAVMQNEQLAKQEGQLRVQEINEARHQMLIQDTMTLSSMKQTSQMAYSQALYQYQQDRKQRAMEAKMKADSAKTDWIIGGLQVIGGAALVVVGAVGTVFTAGTSVGVAAAGVGLIGKGAGDIAHGVAENEASAELNRGL